MPMRHASTVALLFLMFAAALPSQETPPPQVGPISDAEVHQAIGRFSIDDPKSFELTVRRLASFGVRAVPHLTRVAGDKGFAARVRNGCLQALTAIGPSSLPALATAIEVLSDEVALLRAQAIEVIGAIGPAARSASPAVERCLADSDDQVRARALFVFVLLAEERATVLPTVIRSLDDKADNVVATAALVLHEFYGAKAEQHVQRVAQLLEKTHPQVARNARMAMASMGDSAIPVIVETLRARDAAGDPGDAEAKARQLQRRVAAIEVVAIMRPIRQPALEAVVDLFRNAEGQILDAAAVALRRIAEPAVPYLAKVAEDATLPLERRQRALTELGTIGDPARSASPTIVAALRHEDARLRKAAAETVMKIPSGVPGSVEALVPMLDSTDIEVRMFATQAIGQAGSAAKPALAKLADMLGSDPRSSRVAATALARLGTEVAPILPVLIERLDSEDTSMRLRNVDALGLIGPSVAQPLLVELREATSLRKRRSIVLVFQLLAERLAADASAEALSNDVIAELSGLLAAKEDVLVRDAAIALGRFGAAARSAVDKLLEVARKGETEARVAAFFGLGRIHASDSRVFAVFEEALKASSADLRWAALEALGSEGNAKAVPLLTSKLESQDELERMRAAESLGRIGKAAREAIPALQKAARREIVRHVAESMNAAIRALTS